MSGNESMNRGAPTSEYENESSEAIPATETIPNPASTEAGETNKMPTLPSDACPQLNPLVENQNANNSKRVIRKFMVIDPKKLQQAGLDRTLAEAIGRQKLKTLAEEQNKKKQANHTKHLSECIPSPGGDGKIKQELEPDIIVENPTTPQSTRAPNDQYSATDTGETKAIKKFQSVKNILLKSPKLESTSGITEVMKPTISSAAEPTTSIRRVFVTPKITITSPVEASSPSIHISPQHRLENVKHILQHKILIKQQLAAQSHQAKPNFQFSGAATSKPNTSNCLQSPKSLEPKIERGDQILNNFKEKRPQQPSPAKTREDIARVLDFDTQATVATTSGATTIVKAKNTNDMKNEKAQEPQSSLENLYKSRPEVARLIARFGNVIQPLNKSHTIPTTSTIPPKGEKLSPMNPMPLLTIPKATIKCEKLPVESTNKKVQPRKERNKKVSVTIPKEKKVSLPTKTQDQIINVRQEHDNGGGKSCIIEPKIKQTLELSQFEDFPLYSPLKQPFPIVTHAQDLPLPTIATFSRTPFPTSLIRIGEMANSQNNTTQPQSPNTKNPTSLVVLENKVLSQDERIDLTGLALETPKTDLTTSMNNTNVAHSSASHIQQLPLKDTECNTVSQLAVASTSNLNLTPIPTDGHKINNRTILSMNKVKLSTQQIAALVKAINANKTNAPKQFVMIRNIKTLQKPTEGSTEFSSANSSKILSSEALNTHMLVHSTANVNLTTLYANTTFGSTPKALLNTKDQIANIPETPLPKINSYATISYNSQANTLTQKSGAPITYLSQATLLTQNTGDTKNQFSQQNASTKGNSVPIKYVADESPLLQNKNGSTNFASQQETLAQNTSASIHYISQEGALIQAQNSGITSPTIASPALPNKPKENAKDLEPTLLEVSTATVPKQEILSDGESQSDTEVQFKNPLPRNRKKTDDSVQNKCGVSVIDSGDESDPSISAVDFIASLAAAHPITEETQLELSPEELNLNASFSKNFSPLRIPSRNRTDSIKSELAFDPYIPPAGSKMLSTEMLEADTAAIDVGIGKIITISEENILKAVNDANQHHKTQIDKKQLTNKAQEISKLSKNIEYQDTMQQEDSMENVNNLDLITTNDLAEMKVGPIIVKNIEIGNISDIQETRSDPAILQNLKNSLACSNENLSKTEPKVLADATQNKANILPVKIADGLQINNINRAKQADGSDLNLDVHSKPVIQKPKSISLSPVKTGIVTVPPSCEQSHNVDGTLNTEKPSTSRISVKKFITESNFETRTSCETSNAAPKRLPRLMKGKINLVQRRKTPISLQEVKKNSATEEIAITDAQPKETLKSNILDIEDKEGHNTSIRIEAEEKTVVREVAKDMPKLVKVPQQVDSVTSIQQEKAVENTTYSTVNVTEKIDRDIPVEDALSTTANTLLESGDLKRKTAKTSELLNPPKKSKRKFFVEDMTLDIESDESDAGSRNNILLEAITVVSQEPLLSPAKIPFKKAKQKPINDEKPIKGISNLLTKFIKENPLNENKPELQENASSSNKLVELIDVDASSSDSLQIASTDVTENPTILRDQSKQMSENSIEGSKRKTEFKTKHETSLNAELGVESKLEDRAAILNETAGNENNEAAKTFEVTKDCDIVNVIANELIQAKYNEGNASKADAEDVHSSKESDEKLKGDFLGFDQSSPGMQNIDSNLQHLITITNSAEKTRTCEKNYSTTERESPHDTKNQRLPTKSWLTSAIATSNKSNLIMERRASMSRQSVPLKKRWEVLPRSEDDIEISDDLTPEYEDDDYESNHASSHTTLKTLGNDMGKNVEDEAFNTIRKEVVSEKGSEKGDPAKTLGAVPHIIEAMDPTESSSRIQQNSKDDMFPTDQVKETINFLESTPSGPSKKKRIEEETKTAIALETEKIQNEKGAKPTKSIESAPKQGVDVTNSLVEDNSMDHIEITNEIIPKAKSKSTRKSKLKKGSNEVNQMTNECTEAGTTDISEHLRDTTKNTNDTSSTKELSNEIEIGKRTTRRYKSANKVEVERVVDLTQSSIEQVKAVKMGGRQDNKNSSLIEEKRTSKRKSKGGELSPPMTEVVVKEEFVITASELVVPSLKEIQTSLETSESQNMGIELLQELTTSTPTTAQTKEINVRGSRRKRKTLEDSDVTSAKKQKILENTLSDDEDNSLLIVRKKRGPKTIDTIVEDINDNNGSRASTNLNVTQVSDLSQTVVETPIKIPKKRGRKPKVIDPESVVITNPVRPDANEVPKRRARKSNNLDLDGNGDFNERLLLITKREQLETDEVLTEEPIASTSTSKKSSIQCGLCLKEMARGTWVEHLSTHYGVGWIIGETPVIKVKHRNEVLKTMIAYLKTNAGKYSLTCRMCRRTYKSGLGTLLHIEICGATDNRQKCDYCNVEYAKSGIQIHMRVCAQRMATTNDVTVEEDVDAIKEPVLNNVGRRKRASVQKAEKIIKAIGSDKKQTIVSHKDAKQYIKFVPGIEHIIKQWTSDLESLNRIHCPSPNCTYGAQDLESMKTHFGKCELKEIAPKGVYMCKICVDSTKTYPNEKHATIHVFKEHKHFEDMPDFEADGSDCVVNTDDETSDDDVGPSGVDSDEEDDKPNDESNDDEERRKRNKSKRNPPVHPAYLLDRVLHPPRDFDYSNTAMRLWEEFKSEHYSTQPLFTDIRVNFNLCPHTDFEQYLPQWESSMKFYFDPQLKLTHPKGKKRFGKSEPNVQWSQLQRFEAISSKNEELIFIGEAIKFCEWVPLPSDIKEQYLLVSTRRDYTRRKNPKTYNTLLWLYKAAPAKGLQPLKLRLHYAINIPDGPVHCLAFLPSGGYDVNTNRLGLVAIGSVTSTVKVYALPLIVKEQEEGATDESLKAGGSAQAILEDLTTLNLEPVWLLTLDPYKTALSSHPLVDTQCKVLCWSEFSGHTQVFAGYANGCISYWDITFEMNLNRLMVNDVPNYVPINFFYTRERNINAMAIHYDSSGVRLLAVSLARRLLLIYDLDEIDNPFLLKDEVTRNEVLDMEWSPLWQTVALALADSFQTNGRALYAVSPNNIVFKNETIEKLNGGVTQTHYNPSHHMLANSTDTGDIVLLNIREMHLREMVSEAKGNRAAAIMDMKCLDGTDIPSFNPKSVPADWSFYEKSCKEKYGLVFGPMEKVNYKQCINEQRRPPLHLIQCTRINSLRCNKNFAGRKLLALGYENGFLRVLNVDRNLYFD